MAVGIFGAGDIHSPAVSDRGDDRVSTGMRKEGVGRFRAGWKTTRAIAPAEMT